MATWKWNTITTWASRNWKSTLAISAIGVVTILLVSATIRGCASAPLSPSGATATSSGNYNLLFFAIVLAILAAWTRSHTHTSLGLLIVAFIAFATWLSPTSWLIEHLLKFTSTGGGILLLLAGIFLIILAYRFRDQQKILNLLVAIGIILLSLWALPEIISALPKAQAMWLSAFQIPFDIVLLLAIATFIWMIAKGSGFLWWRLILFFILMIAWIGPSMAQVKSRYDAAINNFTLPGSVKEDSEKVHNWFRKKIDEATRPEQKIPKREIQHTTPPSTPSSPRIRPDRPDFVEKRERIVGESERFQRQVVPPPRPTPPPRTPTVVVGGEAKGLRYTDPPVAQRQQPSYNGQGHQGRDW